MKRRKFLQSSLAAAAGVSVTINPLLAADQPSTQKEVYEWREYEARFGSDLGQLEDYFKVALIPALNKYGIKNVGVFKEWRSSEPDITAAITLVARNYFSEK